MASRTAGLRGKPAQAGVRRQRRAARSGAPGVPAAVGHGAAAAVSAGGEPQGQRVQQRSLASPRGAEDEEQGAGGDGAAHAVCAPRRVSAWRVARGSKKQDESGVQYAVRAPRRRCPADVSPPSRPRRSSERERPESMMAPPRGSATAPPSFSAAARAKGCPSHMEWLSGSSGASRVIRTAGAAHGISPQRARIRATGACVWRPGAKRIILVRSTYRRSTTRGTTSCLHQASLFRRRCHGLASRVAVRGARRSSLLHRLPAARRRARGSAARRGATCARDRRRPRRTCGCGAARRCGALRQPARAAQPRGACRPGLRLPRLAGRGAGRATRS